MTAALLRLEDVSIERGRRTVVESVSLTLGAGEILLLIGHNGSGKTTLLHAIAGLIPVREGMIEWERGPGDNRRPATLLQEPSLFLALNAVQNICGGAAGRFRPGQTCRAQIRDEVAQHFPELLPLWGSLGSNLSGGMRRMVGIARTMKTSASLYLLDEPAVGLSASLAERCFDVIRGRADEGAGVLLVEHGAAAARIATRLCIMRDGRIVYDGDTEVLGDEERLRNLYL